MIDIDAMTLKQLLDRQRRRPAPTAGLALVVQGDACRGWSLRMHWRSRALADEHCREIGGLRLLASEQHWQQLEGGRIGSDVRGIWVEFQPAGCRCASGACEQ